MSFSPLYSVIVVFVNISKSNTPFIFSPPAQYTQKLFLLHSIPRACMYVQSGMEQGSNFMDLLKLHVV